MASTPQRVLVVKTSSMGDVVHALPALTDMLAALPGLEVDWLVEKPFADIVRLHPGVRRVLPLAWRKWRRNLWRADTRAAMAALRAELKRDPYDLVLDLQGLLKSALWGLQANGPLAGYDRSSAREPLAALLYHRQAEVPRALQAVDRNRRLAAQLLGYALPAGRPDFGLRPPAGSWQPPAACGLLIPCASRPEKLWPEPHWVALGQQMQASGLTPVLLWGSPEEEARARRIADGCGGVLPPFLGVGDTAAVIGRARVAVGLDTGFSHRAAALGRPTTGIYCDHDPGLAGITGPGPVASLGGKGQPPSLAAVADSLRRHLAGLPAG